MQDDKPKIKLTPEALTRKVRVTSGAVYRDGERYGPGSTFECGEETLAGLGARVQVLETSEEIKTKEAESGDGTPEILTDETAASLRGMTVAELKEIAALAGIARTGSMTKNVLIDQLVAMLPEDAR